MTTGCGYRAVSAGYVTAKPESGSNRLAARAVVVGVVLLAKDRPAGAARKHFDRLGSQLGIALGIEAR